MKRMTAKKRLLVVFIAAVAVGATVALVFIFQFFGDAVRERSDLYISARTDYPGLLDSLRPRTDHHWAFDRYAGRLELERSFKPGHYVLEPGMNVVEIARMLKLGMRPCALRSTMPVPALFSLRGWPASSMPILRS
jgi:UPF0755 protein